MADLESVPGVQDSINADKNSMTGSETQTVSPIRWDTRPRRVYNVKNHTTGEQIKLLRTHLKLNVKEFAELIGYSRPYVSMVEHGKIEASEEFLKSVCAVTGVTIGWLRGADESDGAGEYSVGENDPDMDAGKNASVGAAVTVFNDAKQEENDDDEVLARAFQYTEESRKAIRDRNLTEGKHLNGIPSSDLETLNEEERIKHQETIEARGKRLKQLRKENAHSIRQCADTVPLSTSTIILVEGGKREMTKGLAKKLENAYDVSSKWLLDGDEVSKDWPCGEKMISFLERHPDVRKYVWEKMMEEENRE